MSTICVLDGNNICYQMFEFYDGDILTIEDEYITLDNITENCVGKKWNGETFETIEEIELERTPHITKTDILLAEILLEIEKLKLKLGGE